MAGRGKKKRKPGGQFHPPQDPAMPLKSVMQEAFVTNILKGFTQYEAYRAAGYKVSDKQLHSAASRLSRNVNVLARLDHCRAEIERKTTEKLEIKAEEVLGEIKKMAFSNIDDFATVDEEGHVRLLPFNEITREQKAAIQKLRLKHTIRKSSDGSKDVVETATTELDFYNKLTACAELLDRIQGKARRGVDVRGVIVNRELSDEEMARLIQEPGCTDCEDAIAH